MRAKTARPLGPFPLEHDGSVLWPVVDRCAETRISWTRADGDCYGLLASRLWHRETSRYVISLSKRSTERTALHNLILPPPVGMVVDHVQGDKLDHRRVALRHLTPVQNSMNQPGRRIGRSSQFHGVTLHRQTGKWQAAATHRGRCVYAGLFAKEIDAAAARDRLAARLWPGLVVPNLETPPDEESSMIRTVTLQLDKTTKGALRYRELDQEGQILPRDADAVVGSIYLRKASVGSEPPSRVTITIEAA